ncbi:hypothetical protein [Luedemannella helvata]|uniref:Ankyrin repeat domain-containing protein n=1 Tax=Luedemannella helvata TaxID=349315 RepID=A0ABN2L5G5_9ACTN
MATVSLPENPNLDQLRRQARELWRAARAGDPAALARITDGHPAPPAELSALPLSAAQLVLARESGFPSWPRLRRYLDAVTAYGWAPRRWVRLLLSLGADPALRDARFDATPADWARHLGHEEVLDDLRGFRPS